MTNTNRKTQTDREKLSVVRAPKPPMMRGWHLAFFAAGATAAEAEARFRQPPGWWAQALADAEARGWVRSPGASPVWFLTLRGMCHAEFPKRAA